MSQIYILLKKGNFEAAKRRASSHPEEIRQKHENRLSAVSVAIGMVPRVPVDVVEVLLREDAAYSKRTGQVVALMQRLETGDPRCSLIERKTLAKLVVRLDRNDDTPSGKQLLDVFRLVDRYIPHCWSEIAGSVDNFLVELVRAAEESLRRNRERFPYENFRATCQYLIKFHPSLLEGTIRLESSQTLHTLDFIMMARCIFAEHQRDIMDCVFPPDVGSGNILHRLTDSKVKVTHASVYRFLGEYRATKRAELFMGKDAAGDTAVHKALKNVQPEKIAPLLSHLASFGSDEERASLMLLDKNRETALEVAIKRTPRLHYDFAVVVFGLYPRAVEKLEFPVSIYPFLLANPNRSLRLCDNRATNSNEIYHLLKTRPDLVPH